MRWKPCRTAFHHSPWRRHWLGRQGPVASLAPPAGRGVVRMGWVFFRWGFETMNSSGKCSQFDAEHQPYFEWKHVETNLPSPTARVYVELVELIWTNASRTCEDEWITAKVPAQPWGTVWMIWSWNLHIRKLSKGGKKSEIFQATSNSVFTSEGTMLFSEFQ